MVILSSCLIRPIIKFILPLNEYGCVYASTSSTLEQRCEILRRFFENHGNQNIAAVAESVCEAPSTSVHRRCQQLNISETSLWRILHKDLGIPPYKIQLVQELKPIEHQMRFRFAKWACDRLTEDADFGKKKIISSDEYHFSRSWRVCKQAKLSHLGHRKPAPKTSHCLWRILV